MNDATPAPQDRTHDEAFAEPEPIEVHEARGLAVHHDVRVPVVVGLLSAVLFVAWFARALGTGSVLDWLWCAVPAAVGLLMLAVLRDARAPLLVADEQGVRVRHRQTWNGVRWFDVEQVEVRESTGLRDGALLVHPGGAHDSGSFSVPLGRGVRVVRDGLDGTLVDDLGALAAGQAPVAVLAPEPATETEEPDEPVEPAEPAEPAEAAEPVEVVEPLEVLAVHRAGPDAEDHLPEQREPEAEVEPSRAPRPATRDETVRETVRRLPDPVAGAPAVPAQRESAAPTLVSRVGQLDPAPMSGAVTGAVTGAAADPVIGPLIAAARQRARLSIDTLSERTRIRPHVLECIEVDDFESCGGDFYARGHLRTLARIFGLDGDDLVRIYDERYARPEVQARQVFEAELATGIGGGVRTTTSGPRWSMLAAAVLVLVGIWGTTRVFSDTPQELVSPSPQIADTVGLANGEETAAPEPESTLGAIRIRTVGDASQVVVRDGNGRILFAERLQAGAEQRVIGNAPFDVTASNGQAVRVSYLGENRGAVGDSDAADNRRFG